MVQNKRISEINHLLLFTVLFLAGLSATAQQGSSGPQGDDYTFQVGNSLVSQIDNVREILPVAGVAYSTTLLSGRIEPHYFHSSAYGIQYNVLGASYRMDFNQDDTTVFGGAGLDIHNWKTLEDPNRKTQYGLHVMGGLMVLMTQALWFRTELRFYGNPGFALYYGFGIVVRL